VLGGEVAGIVALGCASVGIIAERDALVCEGGEDVAREDDAQERGYGGEHDHGRERAKNVWQAGRRLALTWGLRGDINNDILGLSLTTGAECG
jgi:hypothetical protein